MINSCIYDYYIGSGLQASDQVSVARGRRMEDR